MRHDKVLAMADNPFGALDRDSAVPDQINAAFSSALAFPLHLATSALIGAAELDAWVEVSPHSSESFIAKVRDTIARAFDAREASALTEIHETLFLLYDLHVVDGADPRAVNQFSPLLTHARGLIERAWLDSERRRVTIGAVPAGTQAVIQALRTMWLGHRAAAHPLFEFLERDASRGQIVAFFRSDSALNLRFFDLLLYSLIGSRVEVRSELIQNLWDESGRGNPALTHVNLFQHLLDVAGIGGSGDDHAKQLGLEGLAGHNLFMLTSLNRAHYFKLLGVMAVTELLDPSQYEKLVRGCKRVGFGTNDELCYYEEHVTVDVVHGEGWLANVIVPILDRTPSAAADILFGAALRLSSCDAYYDALYTKLLALPPVCR